MILLVFNDIYVATYRLINYINVNTLLGYQFINTYGNINNNISILILANINENHQVNRYYNENNTDPIL